MGDKGDSVIKVADHKTSQKRRAINLSLVEQEGVESPFSGKPPEVAPLVTGTKEPVGVSVQDPVNVPPATIGATSSMTLLSNSKRLRNGMSVGINGVELARSSLRTETPTPGSKPSGSKSS